MQIRICTTIADISAEGQGLIHPDRCAKGKQFCIQPGGLKMPTILGAIPGMSAFATFMMKKEMEKIDIPPVREFIEMIHDTGAEIYACKATVDMFHLSEKDFCPQMDAIINVGTFYEKSAGAEIIFT